MSDRGVNQSGRDVDLSDAAAAATRISSAETSRGDAALRCDIPLRRVAATPQLRYSTETSRGDAAAATRIFRGDES